MTIARSFRVWILAVAIIAPAGAAVLSAHPSATTTIAIAADGAEVVTVAISADADPLVAKLEAMQGTAASAPVMSAAERVARLRALAGVLTGEIDLQIDGTKARLTLDNVAVDEAGKAELDFHAPRSRDAVNVRWSSNFIYGSYPVSFRRTDKTETVLWLQGPEATPALALVGATNHLSIGRGVWMGFTHILPNGFDHILFVTGLFLLSTRARQVFAQVSAFTVAHSITLGLSLYGVFSLPPKIVEPLIALSVAYVGVENLLTSRLQPWRVVIVFGFGLLHGLGFAEALAGLHLSRSSLLSTLVSFNVGVEAGQLTVIAIAATALFIAVRLRRSLQRPLTQLASAGIGVAGLIWMIQRIV